MTDTEYQLLYAAVSLARNHDIETLSGLVSAMGRVGYNEREAKRAIQIWRELGGPPDAQGEA